MSADAGVIALEHLMHVNGMTFDEAITMLVQANQQWDERSEYEWSVIIEERLVEKFPALDGLKI
jgi:hypothetical protein